MIIKAYRSESYKAVAEYKAECIVGVPDPEYMDDQIREELRNGAAPLLCFVDKETGSNICIPVQFVIGIMEE